MPSVEHSTDPRAFWDEMYQRRDPDRLGSPHPLLVDVADGATAGSALDLGSGSGANAVWLAGRGWTVTAVDVSQVALDMTARHAERAGASARVRPLRADLRDWRPDGTFDLVCSFFLHTPLELDTGALLARAASWVAPGGTLLVVGHATLPPWAWNPEAPPDDLGASDLVAALGLDGPGWEVRLAEEVERTATGPEGQQADVRDTVLHAVRQA